MKRLLVRIRQLGNKIIHVLAKNELLLLLVTIVLFICTFFSACLIIISFLYNFVLFFVALIILILVWIGWALIEMVRDEQDFYF